jgi:Haem-binding uptake, Tiki superfamily, ChaN
MATTATVRGSSTLGRTARQASGQRAALARVERAIRSSVRPPRSRYLQEFAEAFRGFEGRLTPAEVLTRACAADVVLIGDYHSLASCQEFTALLLGQLAERDAREIVLGLESVYSAAQAVLDEWWRDGVDEESLRSRLRFARDWGYDWEPYRELFKVARRECAAVWGLDSEPRFDLRRVRMRDRHMAGRIVAMREEHPEARLVVFVGESHLAPGHLPRLLRESLPGERVLTVLQNVDALYWRATEVGGMPPAVAVSEDCVCVFNASPLEKYESYQEYLERWRG